MRHIVRYYFISIFENIVIFRYFLKISIKKAGIIDIYQKNPNKLLYACVVRWLYLD